MTKGCKILAALLVLTLCMSVNLFAERTRQVGVNSNGDLDLSAVMNLNPMEFDQAAGTLNGSKVIRTGDRTAITDDGRHIRFELNGDVSKIHVDGQTLAIYADGTIPVSKPETYMAFAAQSLTFEDPLTGMPVNASGAVRIRDFEATDTADVVVESNDFDNRVANYQEALSGLRGVQSTTFDIGGVEFAIYANGAVLFDPELPKKLVSMNPEVLDDIHGAQLPVAIPMFTVDNGNLLFGNGVVKH